MSSKRLWAPWRLGYITSARKPLSSGCLFCRLRRSRSDDKQHVLTRGRLAFSILNRFPYNNGHLLFAPYRHVGRLERLTETEWLDLFRLVRDAIDRFEKVLAPHGYNIGINIGRASGAGIPGHLHLHIVPRWLGDTNFMPILTNTKVISQSLSSAYRQLKQTGGKKPHARKKRR